MGLYSGELIIGRIFASEILGAYFREGLLFFLFWEGGGGGLSSEFYGMPVTFRQNSPSLSIYYVFFFKVTYLQSISENNPTRATCREDPVWSKIELSL